MSPRSAVSVAIGLCAAGAGGRLIRSMLFGLAPTDAVIIALAVLTLSVVAVSAGRKLDSDLRIAAVRHPDFAKKVRSIVVEFGSTSEQYP